MRSRRKQVAVALALLAALLMPSLALAYSYYVDFTITESAGTAYTSLPLSGLSNNTYYVANGYISATGLNTRVYNSDNTALPHMLSEDKTWFVTPQPANNSQVVRYAMGESALSAFDIIPGYGGYVATDDNASLELGRAFDLSISGYALPYSAAGQNLWYKSGAGKLDVSAASTVTWHALNADNTDNWTMTGTAAPGAHTFRVYSDGSEASLYVDGAEVDSEILFTTNFVNLGAISNDALNAGNRYGFYDAGLYWQFYVATNDNINYKTSSDGATWSGATAITTDNVVTTALRFSTYFDGTYVHYARYGNATTIYYRRGTPVSDGSISWSAAEQTVTVVALNTSPVISIAVSTTGYPQIAYRRTQGAFTVVCVIKSSTNDGTWATEGGYPQDILGATSYSTTPYIEALTAGKMYLIFSQRNNGSGAQERTYGRVFNGSVWSGVNDTFSSVTAGGPISLVGDDSGNVYTVYVTSADARQWRIRYSDGSLGSELDLGLGNLIDPTLTYDSVSNTVWMFYNVSDGGTLKTFYRRYLIGSGTFEDAVALNTTNLSFYPSSYSRVFDNHIGIGSQNTANLYHQYLDFPWSWNDNANDHLWMGGNSMSYADNMTLSVSGTQVLRYAPDSIISGTTLPDESGNGNDGIFSWGTNPATVSVVPGPFAPNVPTSTPTAPGSPWTLVPPGQTATPTGLFDEGGECMLGIAELADASEATGNPRELFPIMVAFLLALVIGFAVYGATHVARVGQKGSLFLQSVASLAVLIFFYVGGCGIIPGWVVIPFGLEALFVLVGRNPQHTAT